MGETKLTVETVVKVDVKEAGNFIEDVNSLFRISNSTE